jgi:hypothetical protein
MKRLPYLALTAALVAAVLVWKDRQPQRPALEPVLDAFPETTLMLPFVRDRLARDVLDGRRSLLATATLFGELNRLKGETADCARIPGTELPLSLPGRTAAERLCQHVERWVRAVLKNDPDRADVAIARLEAEFHAAVRERGEIRLPDPASLEPVERIVHRIRESLSPLQRRNPCPR